MSEDRRVRRAEGTVRVTIDLRRDERVLLDRVRDRLGARSYAETVGRTLRWIDRTDGTVP